MEPSRQVIVQGARRKPGARHDAMLHSTPSIYPSVETEHHFVLALFISSSSSPPRRNSLWSQLMPCSVLQSPPFPSHSLTIPFFSLHHCGLKRGGKKSHRFALSCSWGARAVSGDSASTSTTLCFQTEASLIGRLRETSTAASMTLSQSQPSESWHFHEWARCVHTHSLVVFYPHVRKILSNNYARKEHDTKRLHLKI